MLIRLCAVVLSLSAFLSAQDGTGPLIDPKFSDLKNDPVLDPLPEIPDDQSAIPEDWLGLVCWNIQVGGTSTSPEATRPPLVGRALDRMFAGTYELLAAQEISSDANAELLQGLLPGGTDAWSTIFFDTDDRQDNGFWLRPPAALREDAPEPKPLFVTGMTDDSGRIISDPSRAVHPPVAGHFTVGDFDFTLIVLHLTFAGSDTQESIRELENLLDYLDLYFERPGHDPDVILCGDFNIPSLLSGHTGSGGAVLDPVFDDDERFQEGERRFAVTVHERTSRRTAANGGVPNSNFDHFVFSADVMEELIQARRVSTDVLTDDPADPEERLTSDHFPIIGFFRTSGEGVGLDMGPKVTAVVNGAAFEPGITPGAWISIFGRGLAPAARIWRAEEIEDGVLPTELDGVSVRINGRPAAVFFISPGQLNVQAPDDTPGGGVLVEVLREGEVIGALEVSLEPFAPGFFEFEPEGRRFIAAVHPDGTLVGKPDPFGGALEARPAKPGDIILLFGTGFGPTDPPVPAGEVFTGAADLANEVEIRFGEIRAEVPFAGLSGAGLNQFNVRVPEGLQGGDVQVVAEIAGFRTQEDAFITVEGTPPPPPAGPGEIVISQVYGGGGNSGAPLANDFVELFNRGGSAVNMDGWTVQYASAGGDRWLATALSGTIAPGQYFLVQQGMGRSGDGSPLLPPDVVDEIGFSASEGKVALVRSGELLESKFPSSAEIVDFAGYGDPTYAEGAPAPELDNGTAAIRRGGGCVDTDNNAGDFEVATPGPRNSSSPLNLCD